MQYGILRRIYLEFGFQRSSVLTCEPNSLSQPIGTLRVRRVTVFCCGVDFDTLRLWRQRSHRDVSVLIVTSAFAMTSCVTARSRLSVRWRHHVISSVRMMTSSRHHVCPVRDVIASRSVRTTVDWHIARVSRLAYCRNLRIGYYLAKCTSLMGCYTIGDRRGEYEHMKTVARAWHKTINGLFKRFWCSTDVFRNKPDIFEKHFIVRAVLIVVFYFFLLFFLGAYAQKNMARNVDDRNAVFSSMFFLGGLL